MRTRNRILSAIAIAALCVVPAAAQRGGRGAPDLSPRAGAPVDLTGTWVSIVTEDWRWRMVTPPKGDYSSVPLNPAGVSVVNAWDPAKDTAAGEQCRAYGAGAIMRQPGRVRISWQDDDTLKIVAEAGAQTRLFTFGASANAGERTWQGMSKAAWQYAASARRGGGAPKGGSLKVVTTNLRAGYLRKNGVPYSENAVVTEYFNRITDPVDNQTYLVVTTVIDDPQYLAQRFFTSSHFRRVDDGVWKPRPCTAG